LVIFGDGMFGKKNLVHLGGHRHGVVGVLWRKLKQKEYQGQVVAIRIDEFLTSQVSIMFVNNSYTIIILIDNFCLDLQ
jgi:hypothetical protein